MPARALLLLALLAGCASAPKPAESEIDVPVEIVVRQVMTLSIFAGAPRVPVCFDAPDLRVSPNVLRRLHESDARVQPCTAKQPFNKGRAVWVHVRSFTKPASDTYVIHAGYWCGLLCADDTEFTVQKRGGSWAITQQKLQWIS